MTLLLEMFTYPFIVRAFAAGVLLSLCVRRCWGCRWCSSGTP